MHLGIMDFHRQLQHGNGNLVMMKYQEIRQVLRQVRIFNLLPICFVFKILWGYCVKPVLMQIGITLHVFTRESRKYEF